MTTDVQAAQDLYNQLKPTAVRSARTYVMNRTPSYLQDEMATIIDSDIPPVDAPTVIDNPFINQTGTGAASTLHCTLGNWNGAPTARVYQWKVNNVVVGTNSPNYTVAAGDVGKPAVCNMVATNGVGSSAPVASNQIVVA
jgi:hypothetical protein